MKEQRTPSAAGLEWWMLPATVYAVGTWVYGGWYIWLHWAEADLWSYGVLMYYAFIRALIWPIWMVLEFV